MSDQILLIDRIEFTTIFVKHNFGEFERDPVFPQLDFDSRNIKFFTRSDLIYPDDELDDPRHFVLVYGVRVASDSGSAQPPYDIEIEARGYFSYVGDNEFEGANRFRAVRFSGYQVLYGAIREMVANLTARGRHGIWHLPARQFGAIAKSRAEADEITRQEALAKRKVESQSPSTTQSSEDSVPSKKKKARRKLPES